MVVTEPTVSGVHDLKRVLDVIHFFRIRSGIVVNKFDLNLSKTEEIKVIARQSNSDFLGTILYDKSITKAQMKGISVVEYTENEMTEQIKIIWNNIKQFCFDNDK